MSLFLVSLASYRCERPIWVGQGARAYIVNPDCIPGVLNARVNSHWYLHLLDLLEHTKNWAGLLLPEPFAHSLLPDVSGRGSGRLRQMFSAEEYANTEFVLLKLDKSWGLANRVRTIVAAIAFAHMHRVAVVVLF